MIFNTFAYFFAFLLPAATLFRVVPARLRPTVVCLFGAGFFVYFALTEVGGPIGAVCLSIFVWETIFSRLYKKGSFWCLLGVVQSVLFLVVFKYWNFLTGIAYGTPAFCSGHVADHATAVACQAQNPLFWEGLFLPLGISFFTFEFIHYAVDRYKGRTEAGRFDEYFAFILFFPTMVAGPIKRYQDFLPKLESPSDDWKSDFHRGGTRILVGLAKKFAIADLLTAMTDHLNRTDILAAERWVLPVWILAYGFKIYFDFSAYSDIAIGSTRLFGIKVPENFDWPYIRRNIAEFWRYWHISLSKWLTDYVYIPLGGSRVAKPRIYMNLLATMLVSGVWHGAGMNFVVWGLWHGVGLVVQRLFSELRGGKDAKTTTLGAALSTVVTFVYVNLGWAFFCMDVDTALLFFKRLFLG